MPGTVARDDGFHRFVTVRERASVLDGQCITKMNERFKLPRVYHNYDLETRSYTYHIDITIQVRLLKGCEVMKSIISFHILKNFISYFLQVTILLDTYRTFLSLAV